jgi:hypothetical protein
MTEGRNKFCFPETKKCDFRIFFSADGLGGQGGCGGNLYSHAKNKIRAARTLPGKGAYGFEVPKRFDL